MLYPKNKRDELEKELFEKPSCEYRAAPFWAWNGKLKDETLDGQIEMLKKMGMGGFHMHVRTGMDSPYLDKDFMSHARFCVEKARKENMLAWLYDEDRWPSGTAGGKVTANHPEYAMHYLLVTTRPYSENYKDKPFPDCGQHPGRHENGVLLGAWDIELDEKGCLKSYRVIRENEKARGKKWYAYIEHTVDDSWFNNHPYLDTLSDEAVAEFIHVTHDAYAGEFQADFGKTVPAIFTDEPQVARKTLLSFANEEKDVFLPWNEQLQQRLSEQTPDGFMNHMPELLWELPGGKVSVFRYTFYNTVAERFAAAYCRQIGTWCKEHGIAMTGHLYREPTLASHSDSVGETMRNYRAFGLPGVDMLCDRHEYNTVKQVSSIVHQDGKEGMMSELYGVTGWDYEFRGHKLQGDWQAALGVTVRVPHLTWMTMKGEAKRDYPACIGYQSPWWDQYDMVESHFARLNTALTRGRADVRVAVVHPIESFWLKIGPEDQTGLIRKQMDEQFETLTKYLLSGLIDFDFISESCLPEQCERAGAPLKVGQMAYDTVILCGNMNLRSTTLERLLDFQKAGGKIIVIGECPAYLDAVPSEEPEKIFGNAMKVPFDRAAVLEALEDDRFVDVRRMDGSRTDFMVYQHRQDKNCEWLFLANGKNPESPDVEKFDTLRFILNGEYTLTEYDTLSGTINPLPAEVKNGKTIFTRVWHLQDSLLLKLEKGGKTVCGEKTEEKKQTAPMHILRPVEIKLSEPNMYLLDMAEYAVNDGFWHEEEEILRIGNMALTELGLPKHSKHIEQPYTVKEEEYTDRIHLRFEINAEVPVEKPLLALEDADKAEIVFNGEKVDTKVIGWYVDKDISTVALPEVREGVNMLEVTLPIGRRSTIEAMYLLGDFGVRVNGVKKTIIPPVHSSGFGDVVMQGLPFYTGNIDYCFTMETGESLSVRTPYFRGALIKVLVDGRDCGNIAFSPYTVRVKGLEKGVHNVVLRLYGTRQNGFGQLHHLPTVYFYQSPNSWRSEGDLWCYEYQFRPMGILKSPEIVTE